ncbi:Isochorismatase-like protein [Usnea florida]
MTTALLVIDMQNIFLDMTTTALPNILTLCAHFNLTHRPLILTQHGHPPADLTPPFKNQLVRKWGPTNSIATGTPSWSLIPAIALLAAPNANDHPPATVIAKTTYDAFLNTSLSSRLDELGVSRVVVCGVMTDCCCDTTARSAFNRGYETWLVGDACGSANEGQHEAGLRAFGFAFGEVLGTGEVLRRLGGGE